MKHYEVNSSCLAGYNQIIIGERKQKKSMSPVQMINDIEIFYLNSNNFIYSLNGKIKINLIYISGNLQGITVDTKTLNSTKIADIF